MEKKRGGRGEERKKEKTNHPLCLSSSPCAELVTGRRRGKEKRRGRKREKSSTPFVDPTQRCARPQREKREKRKREKRKKKEWRYLLAYLPGTSPDPKPSLWMLVSLPEGGKRKRKEDS